MVGEIGKTGVVLGLGPPDDSSVEYKPQPFSQARSGVWIEFAVAALGVTTHVVIDRPDCLPLIGGTREAARIADEMLREYEARVER